MNGKVFILDTVIACPLLLKIMWQWENKERKKKEGEEAEEKAV